MTKHTRLSRIAPVNSGGDYLSMQDDQDKEESAEGGSVWTSYSDLFMTVAVGAADE